MHQEAKCRAVISAAMLYLRRVLRSATLCFLVSSARGLWPQPQSMFSGTSVLTLAPDFKILLSMPNAPKDLIDAVARTTNHLRTDKLERLVVGRASADASLLSTNATTLPHLIVSLAPSAPTVQSITTEARKPLHERAEAYHLVVPGDGSGATLTANSSLGLLRGLTTFEQLWYYGGSGNPNTTYTLSAPIEIMDSPAYPYRGLMLDTARNYIPVSNLKRLFDQMSGVKLSMFHWHISDAQSFPMQVPGYAELSAKGAYSSSQVYTPEDMAGLVAYAGERGIDILLEIDTPGHTAIFAASHPDYVACFEADWQVYAEEPPAGQLRLASSEVVNYTNGLFSVIADMMPSTLLSTGGDELNIPCYEDDEVTQEQLRASGQNLTQALQGFVSTIHSTLRGKGKTPVVKQEVVLDYNLTLPTNIPVSVWKSSDFIASVTQKGHPVILAASDYFYLDCGAGEWVGGDPSANSWCDPFKTWQKSYSFVPTANLTSEEAQLILGGEHSLWTEQSGPSNLESIVWPRAAAGAEVFWSGDARQNLTNALPRLHELAYRMERRGVGVIKLQPEWCVLRPGMCDF
ncbi:glycoside hydrolase family 20 protein [Peniophora sp. CONT]|nr:glycoside hydrolase family 20 protein [Peniophora sp. CONT]